MKNTFKVLLGTVFLIALLVPSSVDPEQAAAGGYCDWAKFVADVTIPDGVPVEPGFPFKKTWRLKNIGTCTWTRAYSLVFVGGEQMGGLSAVNFPNDVPPGTTVDISVDLTAPTNPGVYRGYWQLRNPSGGLFGIGATAVIAIWLQIEVVGRALVTYDFTANLCAAHWASEWGGRLPCTGVIPDARGVIMKLDRPTLESGLVSTSPGILMIPPFEYNESIYGIFPPMVIKLGDRFQALIGCEYGATGCDVQFAIKYVESGPIESSRTYWNSWEKHDGKHSKVSISLNGLAGKTVSLIFILRPLGDTMKDRALWVNPVILRTSDPVPSGPTPQPLPSTPTGVPTASTLSPGTSCDRAAFVADITVPDGTVFAPGQQFTKTWRLKNSGKCTWTTNYSIAFSGGDQMNGPTLLNLPNQVAPGQTIDLSLNLTAPLNAGTYRGYWLLKNANGSSFGIGSTAASPFWLEIKVSGAPPAGTGYDFVANACLAQWTSGAGVLPCPGTNGSDKGFALTVNNPILENNTTESRPGLLMVPQNVYNGSIQGIYPPFVVQNGDRFQSIINCEYGSKGCYVVFRLDYQINNDPIKTLWSFGEKYEGIYYQADIDLSSLSGQNVKFILNVGTAGSPAADRALWVAPRIVRNNSSLSVVSIPTSTIVLPTTTLPSGGAPPTSTLTPTPPSIIPTSTLPSIVPTSTPPSIVQTPTFPSVPVVDGSWSMYQNAVYNFSFRFPPGTVVNGVSPELTVLHLPFTQGTNLQDKYLQVDVRQAVGSCHNPLGWNPSTASSPVMINGIAFLFEAGAEMSGDIVRDWKAYSTMRNGSCISLTFVMQSSNLIPAPQFDRQAESAVFDVILSTFGWTGP